jgi:lipopolysaccharide transport system ATP-binding protein
MSNSTVIKVEGLSKQYLLNKQAMKKSDTLYGSFIQNLKSVKNVTKRKELTEFWALKDVSFEINQGDRVGIIGRNGAGKSTLLKILSRITPPTHGRIEYSGRMASLLEVGTGFHGDLSGRENIYLNGSILGMSKQEIDNKFDEIVAFSEIEKFIDTPVKRYSSGMYVRLAFAVAAHLEPEILIVDEVLAVGDASFQKKCMGKMEDVSQNHGRTILFVSHQMAAVQNLCNKGIYLKNGQLIEQGLIEQVIPTYLKSGAQSNLQSFNHRTDRTGSGKVKFESFRLLNSQKQEIDNAQSGSDFFIELTVNAEEDISNFIASMGIDDDFGTRITHLSNDTTNQIVSVLPKGVSKVIFKINRLPLSSGIYTFTLFSSSGTEVLDWLQDAGKIDVESGDFYHTGKIAPEGQGKIYLDYSVSIL